MIGIYKITNKINNKVYIGQSNNIEKRLSDHFRDLMLNRHKNKHLQAAVNQYGIENFIFKIIDECQESELDNKEIYWIDYYQSFINKNGYNIAIGGNQTRKLTNNDKKEIIKILKNNPYYSKLELAQKYNVSQSSIYSILKDFNIPKSHKICSEETKQKLREYNNSKKLSEEHKKNIGKAVKKNHGYSKFSEQQIKDVIRLLLSGLDNKEIENKTNVSYIVINNIRNKKTWIEFTKDLTFPKVKIKNSGKGNTKLSDKDVVNIINLMLAGLTNKEIQNKTSATYQMIRDIRLKKTFKHLTKDINIPIIKQKNQYK